MRRANKKQAFRARASIRINRQTTIFSFQRTNPRMADFPSVCAARLVVFRHVIGCWCPAHRAVAPPMSKPSLTTVTRAASRGDCSCTRHSGTRFSKNLPGQNLRRTQDSNAGNVPKSTKLVEQNNAKQGDKKRHFSDKNCHFSAQNCHLRRVKPPLASRTQHQISGINGAYPG